MAAAVAWRVLLGLPRDLPPDLTPRCRCPPRCCRPPPPRCPPPPPRCPLH